MDSSRKTKGRRAARSLRSTAITPLHAAWISASRGISMPRCRSSICVNPEQSKPKLLTPPQVYVVPINRCASCSISPMLTGVKSSADVAALHPAHLPIHKPHLEPALGVLRRRRRRFQPRLPRQLQSGRVRRHVGFAINIRAQRRNAHRIALGRVGPAVQRLQVCRLHPARITIRGANVEPALAVLERRARPCHKAPAKPHRSHPSRSCTYSRRAWPPPHPDGRQTAAPEPATRPAARPAPSRP